MTTQLALFTYTKLKSNRSWIGLRLIRENLVSQKKFGASYRRQYYDCFKRKAPYSTHSHENQQGEFAFHRIWSSSLLYQSVYFTLYINKYFNSIFFYYIPKSHEIKSALILFICTQNVYLFKLMSRSWNRIFKMRYIVVVKLLFCCLKVLEVYRIFYMIYYYTSYCYWYVFIWTRHEFINRRNSIFAHEIETQLFLLN